MSGRSPRGTALVTGASSGIGRELARALAVRGHDLVLVARRRERLEELARELGVRGARAEALPADLATDAGVRAVEQRIAAERDLTLLVNDAGFAHFGPFAKEDPDLAEASVRLLALAPVRLTRAALDVFAARAVPLGPYGRGAILQVSSRAAFGPRPELATYAAAKAYLNRFSLALADELEPAGIRVLCLCPGNVWTELFERAGLPEGAIRRAMAPERVAEEALAALDRGQRVCVPGEGARDRLLRRALPRKLARKLASWLERLGG